MVLSHLPPIAEGGDGTRYVTIVHASRTCNLWRKQDGAGNASCTQHVPLKRTARRMCSLHTPPFCLQALREQGEVLYLQLVHQAKEEVPVQVDQEEVPVQALPPLSLPSDHGPVACHACLPRPRRYLSTATSLSSLRCCL